MVHTKFSNYTDSELLSLVDDKRQHSELINELCERLEKRSGAQVKEDANRRVTCPVCEAALEADYDEGNGMFEIRLEG